MKHKSTIVFAAGFILSALILPFVFPDIISPVHRTATDSHILFHIRFPVVLTALFTGGILAAGGLCFQALFRNDLATPYTLGISSGSALGAVFYIVFLSKILSTAFALPLFALCGALLSVGIIMGVTLKKNILSSNVILLTGVAVNFFFASLIMFFQYLGKEYDVYQITRWLLGSVGQPGITGALILGFVFVILLIILMQHSCSLDLVTLGDELAITKGLEIKHFKFQLIIVISVAVAAAISLSGPIGFVGIIIPHIVKNLTKSRHHVLIPASMLVGGIILALCDALGRTLIYPAVLPTGIITAMIGAPVFVYIITRRK